MKRNKTAVNFASLAIIIINLCFLESNVYSTVKKDSGKSAIKPKAQTNDSEKKISLDFDNMDLRDLVLYLNEYAKINYILPANLTGKISVVSPEKIPVSMIPDVLETLLNMNGFATSLNDSYTMIVPISSAKTEPDKIIKLNDTAPLTNKVVLKIIEPKYAAAAVIANTIRQIITSDIRIVVDNSMNRLFITGYGPLIKKFVDLIEIMDVPDVESKILVYKIKNNLAATIATKAAQILTALNSQKGITAPFQIIADEFSNKIVVVSLSLNIEYLESLFSQLDNADDIGTNMRMFFFENIGVKNSAANLAGALKVNPKYVNHLRLTYFYEDIEQNALLVSSSSPEIFEYIENYLKTVDIKGKYKKPTIKVFPIKFGDAESIAANIKKLLPLTDPSFNEKFKLTNIIPDNRNPSIIVSSNFEEIINHIGEIISELDKESNIQKSNIHIYKLQNANAQNVAEVMSKLTFTDNSKLTQAGTPVTVNVPVTFDKSTNSVVFTCSDEQYSQIKKIIEDFDKEKAQILINVIIAEISVEDLEKIGVEWQAGDILNKDYAGGASQNFNMIDASVLKDNKLTDAAKMLPGFSVGVLNLSNPDMGAVINMFKQKTDFNVLSSPKLLTEDNNEASINIGQKVPFITNSRVTDNDATIYSYQYQDVGIILKITPHVSNSKKITLDINQEVKNLLEKAVFDAPLVSTRELKTKITVENKKVIIIGGLISSTKNKTKYAIPLISKLPLIGKLFQRNDDKESKTNLLIIISPEIIEYGNIEKISPPEKDFELFEKNIKIIEKDLKFK